MRSLASFLATGIAIIAILSSSLTASRVNPFVKLYCQDQPQPSKDCIQYILKSTCNSPQIPLLWPVMLDYTVKINDNSNEFTYTFISKDFTYEKAVKMYQDLNLDGLRHPYAESQVNRRDVQVVSTKKCKHQPNVHVNFVLRQSPERR